MKRLSGLLIKHKDKKSEMEVPLIYPADPYGDGDIITNATALDLHPDAEAGAQNTATSFANTRSSISTLTSSIKKVAVAAASSLTKTKQPEEEPPLI